MPRTAAKSGMMHHLETHIKTLRWNSHKTNNYECTAEGCSACSQRLATTGWPQSTLSTGDKALTSIPATPHPHAPAPGDHQVILFLWIYLFWTFYTKGIIQFFVQFSSAQSLSHVQLFVTPWITARQASLSITNSRSSLKLTSIESVMPSSHLILRRPLLLLPPIPPSIRVFSNESTLHMRWFV